MGGWFVCDWLAVNHAFVAHSPISGIATYFLVGICLHSDFACGLGYRTCKPTRAAFALATAQSGILGSGRHYVFNKSVPPGVVGFAGLFCTGLCAFQFECTGKYAS